MNELEYENVFSFDKKNKKYKIKLTNAIKFLLSKQRVIEAKYHFSDLEKVSANSIIVMELGFEIGIKSFDKDMVVKYDGLLDKEPRYKKCHLEMKRMKFWISINRMENAKACVKELLNFSDLDKEVLLKVYDIIHREFNDDELIHLVNMVLKKRNLTIVKR